MPRDDDLARRLQAAADDAVERAGRADAVDGLVDAKRRGARRRRRTRLATGGATLAVVVLVGAAIVQPGTTEDGSTLRTAGSTPASGVVGPGPGGAPDPPDDQAMPAPGEGWVEIAPSPLSPRTGAGAVWTGSEVLIVGGEQHLCPAGAGCARGLPPLLDGAAYDPATDRWRTIAPAPEALGPAFTATLVGDTLVAGTASALGTILTYDIGDDRWDALTTSATRSSSGAPLTPMGTYGDRALLVAIREGPVELATLDPATGAVEPLPAPPLPPLFSTNAVVHDGQIFVFGHEIVPNPGSDGPSLLIGARFDGTTGWARLPDSEMLGDDARMISAGSLLVDSSPGTADGGQVGNWGRPYPYGGTFDPTSDTWRDLPPDRPAGEWRVEWPAHAVGDRVLTRDGLLLDPEAGTWTVVPPPPGPRDRTRSAVVWAGDRLIVWGGETWADPPGALLGSGTSFVPPG